MADPTPTKFTRLVTLLKELFQLDQPDLDFGIYRILHARAAEVSQFLEHDLLPQVKTAFAQYQSGDSAELKRRLDHLITQLSDAGVDPEQSPKVRELREQLQSAVDVGALESDVYDHLYNFFRRYYSEGDFLSKRVYKPGVYAIPYEGEEVKLHWANADQYYIKTSEYLRDYGFRLRPDDETAPMRVHFRLVDAAEGQHGNVKEQAGRERRFRLAAENAAKLEGGDLVIGFTFTPDPSKQKDLNAAAEETILKLADPALADWLKDLGSRHVRADGTPSDATRLRVHLDRYTARNTFDYFIHKDLGGFLRRELDFYIKNEVIHLDDVESESVPRVEQYLSKVKVIRGIAGKIIEFLAQIEDFQRKLWLKKKFVVETAYCIRLGVIPETFYPQIAANDAQRDEWVALYGIDQLDAMFPSLLESDKPAYSCPLTVDFLKAHPTLVLDTRHFGSQFVQQLLEVMGDIDSQTDGLLFQGDNAHVLALLQERFSDGIDSLYIDPPYNTDASAINYKNGYRHASWLALVDERLRRTLPLLRADAVLCITIDDVELHRLRSLTDVALAGYDVLGVVPIKNNPAGRTGTIGFSVCHEYAIFYGVAEEARIGRLEHSAEQRARYKERDEISAFEWTNFRKHGGKNTYRIERPRQFYPIYVDGQSIRIPKMEWDDVGRVWDIKDPPSPTEEVLLPIDERGRERIWDFGAATAREEIAHLCVRKDSRGHTAIYRKWRLNDEGLLPQTWWDKSEYSAAEYGTNLLAHLFGEAHRFAFPKSVHAVADCLRVAGLRRKRSGVALDFFAGSGTTGHAVVSMNREDGGRRMFVLVEQGDYFDTVLLARLKKIVFAPDWKGGRPRRLATSEEAARSPRVMKVIRLESYEDALNNLSLRRMGPQQASLDLRRDYGSKSLKEQYMLKYLLDVETRGSQSLLNLAAFADPTAYKLRVKPTGSDETRDVSIDLIETFNWLIGLRIQHASAPRAFSAEMERDSEGRIRLKGRMKQDAAGPWWFRTVTGATPDGRRVLVIWRKLIGDAERDNLMLETWFRDKQAYSVRDTEFDLIYVNGDSTLENVRVDGERWKVRLIEEDFHRLMFGTTNA